MKRPFLTTFSLAVALASAGPVSAQSVQDQIIRQLTEQGFTRLEVSRTLLGRGRILATSDNYSRELVFNPNTGEILRDYWLDLDDGDAAPLAIPSLGKPSAGGGSGNSGSSGGGFGGADDDDDDGGSGGGSDDDDDKDDDDDDGGRDDSDDDDDGGSDDDDDGGSDDDDDDD